MSLWVSQPKAAHLAWRQAKTLGDPLRSYSEKALAQYTSIWSVFCAWMAANSVNVINVSETQITEFLSSLKGRSKSAHLPAPKASIRTHRMYATELREVFAKLANDELRPDNPMVGILARARAGDPTPRSNVHLPPPNLRPCLRAWREQHGANLQRLSDHALAQHCMAMLMLDCGATLKEIQKLTVNSVHGTTIHLPGHRLILERDVQMSDQVQELMDAWLKRRRKMVALTEPAYKAAMKLSAPRRAIFARYAVEAVEKGTHDQRVLRAFQDDACTLLGLSGSITSTKLFVRVSEASRTVDLVDDKRPALNKIVGVVLARVVDRSIYEAANRLLALAPAHLSRGYAKGPQVLRNGYCAMLIESGVDDVEAQKLMGLRTGHTVNAVRKALQ